MFTGQMIAIAFVLMFVAILLASYFERHKKLKATRFLVVITLALGIYFTIAGVNMAVQWSDSETWKITHKRPYAGTFKRSNRGILIYQFWPYMLIALGGYLSYTSMKVLAGKELVATPDKVDVFSSDLTDAHSATSKKDAQQSATDVQRD